MSTEEDLYLEFIFDEMWSRPETKGFFMATLEDFVDIAPENLREVNMDKVSEIMRARVLNVPKIRNVVASSKNSYKNIMKQFEKRREQHQEKNKQAEEELRAYEKEMEEMEAEWDKEI